MIEITRYQPHKKGSMVAIIDVYLPKIDMHLREIRLVQKDGKTWFNFPSKCNESPDGTKKWVPFFEYGSKETNDRFHRAMGDALERYAQQAPKEENEELPF